MAKSFKCEIVSAEASIFSGAVEQVIAAGVMGDLGISAGSHTAAHRALAGTGSGHPRRRSKKITSYVTGGFLEVQPNVVTILADSAVRADDLE